METNPQEALKHCQTALKARRTEYEIIYGKLVDADTRKAESLRTKARELLIVIEGIETSISHWENLIPKPKPNKAGRPKNDEKIKARARELKGQGLQHKEIADICNNEFHLSKTSDAYRKMK